MPNWHFDRLFSTLGGLWRAVAVCIFVQAGQGAFSSSTRIVGATRYADSPLLNATSSVPRTTQSTVTTTTWGCNGVQRCLSDAGCAECLRVLNATAATRTVSAMGDLTDNAIAKLNVAAFQTFKTTPACRHPSTVQTLLPPAIVELGDNPACTHTFGIALGGGCVVEEYACYFEPACNACWTSLIAHVNRTAEILQTPACRNANISRLNRCIGTFPECSVEKIQCGENSDCDHALTTLRRGDGVAAAQHVPWGTPEAWMFARTIVTCTGQSALGCTVFREWCSQVDECKECLASLPNGFDQAAIARGLSSPACRQVHESNTLRLIQAAIRECSGFSTCVRTISACWIFDAEMCLPCVLGTAPESKADACTDFLGEYSMRTLCTPCPASAFSINALVWATAIIGGLSAAVCIWIGVTIVANQRDRTAMRDRVVLGLMIMNTVYSTTNTIPMQQLQTSSLDACGQLTLGANTIRWARTGWFAGKYGLVAFELLIVAASVHALSQAAPIRPRVEAALHGLCAVVAVTAAAVFYVTCAGINQAGYNRVTEGEAFSDLATHLSADDDVNDDTPSASATDRFDAERDAYDRVVREMLLAWNVLAGGTIVLWAAARVLYSRKVGELRVEEEATTAAEAEDEWRSTRQSGWNARRRLLTAQRSAFADVALPLEPYLAVFAIFLVPAVVMSTSQCEDDSGAEFKRSGAAASGSDNVTFGMCDVGCEFALSFRSLATVAVYVAQRERRAEVVAFGATFSKLASRVVSSCSDTPGNPLQGPDSDATELANLIDCAETETEVSPPIEAPVVADSTLGSWQLHEAAIAKTTCLGKGAFGSVWSGRMVATGDQIAIKVLRMGLVDSEGDLDPEADADFKKEVVALQRVNHPHLLKFFGYGTTAEGSGFIVTELMPGGSLEAALSDKTRELPWRHRVSIGLQVALGMEYLHKIHMVHRDLKSANVLLGSAGGTAVRTIGCGSPVDIANNTSDDNLNATTGDRQSLQNDPGVPVAKVCDFGLVRVVRPRRQQVVYSPFTGVTRAVNPPTPHGGIGSKTETKGSLRDLGITIEGPQSALTRAAGTSLWMAPEVFRGDVDYTPAVDVYSYGLVLYELATRELPWLEIDTDDPAESFRLLNTALQTGRRPIIPPKIVEEFPRFVAVMQKCWAGDPADRPTFSHVAPALAECLRTEA